MIAESASSVHIGPALIPADLVRFAEVARRGLMSLASLHRWRRRKDDPLPSWKFGGTWYVSESELAEWIVRRSQRPNPTPSPVLDRLTPAVRRRAELAAKECRALR
jgi:hypothetical protein